MFKIVFYFKEAKASLYSCCVLGDVALANIVKLLIIDEVHLLHSDRGPVVEAIIARTLRQVSCKQHVTYKTI